jgi:hypothetical protein
MVIVSFLPLRLVLCVHDFCVWVTENITHVGDTAQDVNTYDQGKRTNSRMSCSCHIVENEQTVGCHMHVILCEQTVGCHIHVINGVQEKKSRDKQHRQECVKSDDNKSDPDFFCQDSISTLAQDEGQGEGGKMESRGL